MISMDLQWRGNEMRGFDPPWKSKDELRYAKEEQGEVLRGSDMRRKGKEEDGMETHGSVMEMQGEA